MDITEICAEVRNYFIPHYEDDIHEGTFEIVGNTIAPLDFLKDGQFFRIVGSALNDGVHQYSDDMQLADESFDGAIWAMSVPPAFLALCTDIQAWRAKNEALDSANMSPFTSESFGGYSYSKGGSGSGTSGSSAVWQDVFKSRLNAWRRLNVL